MAHLWMKHLGGTQQISQLGRMTWLIHMRTICVLAYPIGRLWISSRRDTVEFTTWTCDMTQSYAHHVGANINNRCISSRRDTADFTNLDVWHDSVIFVSRVLPYTTGVSALGGTHETVCVKGSSYPLFNQPFVFPIGPPTDSSVRFVMWRRNESRHIRMNHVTFEWVMSRI